MSIETIQDILDWNRRLHEELARIYRDTADGGQNERIRLLLDYLAEHEEHLADTLARYQKDEHRDRLDRWLRDHFAKSSLLEEIRQDLKLEGLDAEAILQATVAAHQKLIALYRELAENAKTAKLEELFSNLASLEAHELMRMVVSGERWSDL